MDQSSEDQTAKIRKYAYELWEKTGSPAGRKEDFLRIAACSIARNEPAVLNDDLDMEGEDSFPASDLVNHT
jgi:hypothetical protein